MLTDGPGAGLVTAAGGVSVLGGSGGFASLVGSVVVGSALDGSDGLFGVLAGGSCGLAGFAGSVFVGSGGSVGLVGDGWFALGSGCASAARP